MQLLPGWFGHANPSGLIAGGTAAFTVSLTGAGNLETFDLSTIDNGLRDYLQCAKPTCSIVLALEAASVRVHARVMHAHASCCH